MMLLQPIERPARPAIGPNEFGPPKLQLFRHDHAEHDHAGNEQHEPYSR
jgi:hypothetical protein